MVTDINAKQRRIESGGFEHIIGANPRHYKKNRSDKQGTVFPAGQPDGREERVLRSDAGFEVIGLVSRAGPGDNCGELVKKPSPNLYICRLLDLLSACVIDEAQELVKENHDQLLEWLKGRERGSILAADRLARFAKNRCSAVPEQAELILQLLKEAGLREQIFNISRSRDAGIARLADGYL